MSSYMWAHIISQWRHRICALLLIVILGLTCSKWTHSNSGLPFRFSHYYFIVCESYPIYFAFLIFDNLPSNLHTCIITPRSENVKSLLPALCDKSDMYIQLTIWYLETKIKLVFSNLPTWLNLSFLVLQIPKISGILHLSMFLILSILAFVTGVPLPRLMMVIFLCIV